MKSLKSTLSTQDRPKAKEKDEANGSLLRGVNKSKSQSMWAFDVEADKVTEASLDTDFLLKILNDKLQNAFKKDSKNISEVTFERVVEEFQDEAGAGKTEMAYLMLIEDKVADIIEIAKQNFKPFLDVFSGMLTAKIAKIRKKEKSSELSNFEKIVSSNFKKKPDEKAYFKIEEAKPTRISKDKAKKESQNSRKASGSADKKLNRLFSKEKKQINIKDSIRKGDEQAFNATTNAAHDESISFSTALSTNVTVRTRKRKSSNEKKDKPKKTEQNSQKEGDEAFMFFRPKKSKK